MLEPLGFTSLVFPFRLFVSAIGFEIHRSKYEYKRVSITAPKLATNVYGKQMHPQVVSWHCQEKEARKRKSGGGPQGEWLSAGLEVIELSQGSTSGLEADRKHGVVQSENMFLLFPL